MARKKSPEVDVDENIEYVPIKVTTGILFHIGAGIYQSIAGALKELVSNSYDADATEVLVSTDYPNFMQIKVVDNGSGMTKTRFRQAMATVGSSLKMILDPARQTPKYSRPIIGKLGIGLMALSQVCSEASIESQAEGSSTKFVAKLDFSEFKRRVAAQERSIRLDVLRERYGGEKEMKALLKKRGLPQETKEDIETLLGVLNNVSAKDKAKEVEYEQLGYCMLFPDLPAKLGEHGTTITLTNIDPPVRELLADIGRARKTLPTHYQERSYTWSQYSDELDKLKWEDLCALLRRSSGGKITYQLLPTYHQFLWELALMTPIQYLSGGPIAMKPNLLRAKKEELANYNFELLVDNRLLRKPIVMPSGSFASKENELEEKYDYHLKTFSYDREVAGEQLKFKGYIYWQRKLVQPSVLRGLQIHIRNVGIGLYDQTLMNFSTVSLTARAGQISGEIYVQEGLERALNVDRNSFRVTDEHYVELQHFVWDLLGSATSGDGVIGTSFDSYWLRKHRENDLQQKQHVKNLRHIVKTVSKEKLDITFYARSSDKPFEITDGHIVVYDQSPRWPRSKPERWLYQRLLIPVEAARASGAKLEDIVSLLESALLNPIDD
jgi:hypothetical protein